MKMIPRRILPINLVLIFIGLIDLITTLYWLHTGSAIEVNPIMSAVLATSLALFIGVKLLTLTAYVAVMEWYRRHRNPIFARVIGNCTVLAYSCIYAVSFCCINHGIFI